MEYYVNVFVVGKRQSVRVSRVWNQQAVWSANPTRRQARESAQAYFATYCRSGDELRLG